GTIILVVPFFVQRKRALLGAMLFFKKGSCVMILGKIMIRRGSPHHNFSVKYIYGKKKVKM
ncbi:MAG: hypothetical protein WC127_06365, partial [Acidaminococcaceae bacterium]